MIIYKRRDQSKLLKQNYQGQYVLKINRETFLNKFFKNKLSLIESLIRSVILRQSIKESQTRLSQVPTNKGLRCIHYKKQM